MAGNAKHWSHQAAFEASPVSASQARDFVSGHLVSHGLPYLVDAVRLVTSELATNALVHAHTAFSVTLAGTDQIVKLTVRDDSLSHPAWRASQASDSTARGMEIVDMVSRDWGTDVDALGSKAVWATFATRGPGEF